MILDFFIFDLNILFYITTVILLILIIVLINNHQKRKYLQKELNLLSRRNMEYEKCINEFRIKNHENRNQLIVLKGLADKNNEELLTFLDSILKTDYKEDDSLFTKVINVPSGGLKGLIYYKLLEMKENRIECHLEVSKEVKNNLNLNTELLQNYYKIIGVFIDNAIDATKILDKKMILIEIYYEKEYLIFSISNEYKEKIDFDKTTKGKNHGYGLKLVKEIVNKYDEIMSDTRINANLFTQRVGVKLL